MTTDQQPPQTHRAVKELWLAIQLHTRLAEFWAAGRIASPEHPEWLHTVYQGAITSVRIG